MKELKLKIKREYYNIFKELTDKQAGELIKGMCAYMYDGKPFFTKDAYLKGSFMSIKRDIDEAKQNSVNGKKSAEAYAAKQRAQTVSRLGIVLGSVLSASGNTAKEEAEKQKSPAVSGGRMSTGGGRI